ncbi:MAG: septum formation initiator family protein [Firmicutes bacterium]|nr:septum formation initiator family protein [Bacillota bacterium]
MTEKEKTRRIQSIIVSACVIFAIFLLIGLIANVVSLVAKTNRIAKLQAQIDELDGIIERSNDEIEYRQTNEYVEKYAREYLEMKKTNEIAFIGR